MRSLVVLALFCGLSAPLAGQTAAGCTADTTYAALDFWVGRWDVYVGDTLVGTNRISRVLEGCAVTEEWQDARGMRGRSLFYVDPLAKQWKQVWVTEWARRTGGVKEKRLIARTPDGGVRFQGELRDSAGGVILDRTTLSPLAAGEVRQLIEVSSDGGATWRAAFDARYRPKP